MVIDFSKLSWKEPPVLILKNLDGTAIQPLMYAHNIEASLYYNETSEISFELPSVVDGEAIPGYDDVVGMRIIDWHEVGQFILVNPEIISDGIKEIKKCKAYSLEHELTYKKTYITEGTYELYDPTSPAGTYLGMIVEDNPSWSVGTVDSALLGKYRTLECSNGASYEFLKNTLQDAFQCIFDFDTYNRRINAIAVSSIAQESPIYLSADNLIKEVKIDEDTENIFTVLDVNGADGVNIMSVNPMGNNKLYNLDYFMNQTTDQVSANNGNSYFSQAIIDKWNTWKTTYENYQHQYFNITMEKVLEEAKLATAKSALTSLNGELSTLETMQATYVEAGAQGIDRSSQLAQAKIDIAEKKAAIASKEAEITSITTAVAGLLGSQITINAACSFSASGFTAEELEVLNRYMKEDAIEEESFVYSEVKSYENDDVSHHFITSSFAVTGASISGATLTGGKTIYSIIGGSASIGTSGISPCVTAKIRRGALEKKSDNSYVLTLNLNSGSVDDTSFPSACVSMMGAGCSITTDITATSNIGGNYIEGSDITSSVGVSDFYFTRNVTEYEKRSVEWDLLDYGKEALSELAWPTYTFDIDSANFLALDDFAVFKNQLAFAKKVYVDIGNDKILKPIVVGVEISIDDPTKCKLKFGDKYSLKDSAFALVDLLNESVKMGKTTSTNRFNYNAFINSGASTQVKEFMTSALDASKNAVLAGANQEMSFDGSGIRMRKYDSTTSDYADEQIWMVNNCIAFTDDNWSTSKMAIGKVFIDDTHTTSGYGIAAPYIIGTLLAGEQLIIEGPKLDGTHAVFKMDGSGASLYNSVFGLYKDLNPGTNSYGNIILDPSIGLVCGQNTTANPLFYYDASNNISGVKLADGSYKTAATSISSTNLPNANMWVDMNGNAYFKGTIYATDGVFSGELSAATGSFSGDISGATGTFSGIVNASDYKINGTSIVDTNNKIKSNFLDLGNITLDGTTGNITLNGNITWNGNNPASGLSSSINDLEDTVGGWTYGSTTKIDGTKIASGTVSAYELQGAVINIYNNDGYESGTITTRTTSTSALDISSNEALRLNAASGYNLYLGNNVGYFQINSTGTTIGGTKIILGNSGSSSNHYGSSLPSGGTEGQIFFKLT